MRPVMFRNGHLFDGRRHRPGCGVVAASGRILAVGPDEELGARVPGGAEVVDLAGGLLLPGFQDAHVHPVQAGLERLRCDLSGLASRTAYLAAVREYADANPDLLWITGGGWSMPVFGTAGPQAVDLDGVVPDRPVFLMNRDHHGAWVNSTALRLAGVDRQTSDPRDGRIERDEAGEPTGTLHEGATWLVERLVTDTTEDEFYRALLAAQEFLHSMGITAWQDALLGDYPGLDDPSSAYLRGVDDGRLTARVRGSLWWDREVGVEQVDSLLVRREILNSGRLRADTVKVMQDGIAENQTAAMTAPYLDEDGHDTGNSGLSFLEPEMLAEAVTRMDAVGFQVHVHAIGDKAIRETLDAFEAARRANGDNDLRHHIAHIQVVHPHDVPRFARLGVVANMQPLWAAYDQQMTDLTIPFLPPDRVAWQYPFGDLLRAGARLAAGSDWPVSSPDPLLGIHVAVNRCEFDTPGSAGSDAFLPEQALTLEQAFAAYTSGSAHVNHLDDTGTLAPGRLADLTVLDRDPFSGDPAEIGAASVVATYVDGVQVFSA